MAQGQGIKTNEWPPRQSINRITWADFIGHATKHGVTLEATVSPPPGQEDPARYLRRIVGPNIERTYALPKDVDLNERMGPFVYESVCKRLELPFNFTGYPIIL